MDISSIYSDYIAQTASSSSTSQLGDLSQTDYTAATEDELLSVCKQFEAYFLEQVYKEMLKTVPTSELSSTGNSTMVDYYKDKVVQDLATQQTEQNGLGLAQMLYEQMKRNYDL